MLTGSCPLVLTISIPVSAEDYDFVRGDVVIGTARFVR